MTLRQVWRFMRDCQITGPDCTLANFDRIYGQGRKNHYSLQPKLKEESKSSNQAVIKVSSNGQDSSDDEEEEDVQSNLATDEDIHIPSK